MGSTAAHLPGSFFFFSESLSFRASSRSRLRDCSRQQEHHTVTACDACHTFHTFHTHLPWALSHAPPGASHTSHTSHTPRARRPRSAAYLEPKALAMVKIGSNNPRARKPIAAATKHRMAGSMRRTA